MLGKFLAYQTNRTSYLVTTGGTPVSHMYSSETGNKVLSRKLSDWTLPATSVPHFDGRVIGIGADSPTFNLPNDIAGVTIAVTFTLLGYTNTGLDPRLKITTSTNTVTGSGVNRNPSLTDTRIAYITVPAGNNPVLSFDNYVAMTLKDIEVYQTGGVGASAPSDAMARPILIVEPREGRKNLTLASTWSPVSVMALNGLAGEHVDGTGYYTDTTTTAASRLVGVLGEAFFNTVTRSYTVKLLNGKGTRIRIRGRHDDGTDRNADFNLDTQEVVATTGTSAGIEVVGNGWYRIWTRADYGPLGTHLSQGIGLLSSAGSATVAYDPTRVLMVREISATTETTPSSQRVYNQYDVRSSTGDNLSYLYNDGGDSMAVRWGTGTYGRIALGSNGFSTHDTVESVNGGVETLTVARQQDALVKKNAFTANDVYNMENLWESQGLRVHKTLPLQAPVSVNLDFNDEYTVFKDLAGTQIAVVGDKIAMVKDKITGFRFNQTDEARRPTLVDLGDGTRGASFDGIDDFLRSQDTLASPGSSSMLAVFDIKTEQGSTNGSNLLSSSTDPTAVYGGLELIVHQANQNNTRMHVRTSINTRVNSTGNISSSYNGLVGYWWEIGGAMGTFQGNYTASSTSTGRDTELVADPLVIGARPDGTRLVKGAIRRMVLTFNSKLSHTEVLNWVISKGK